MAGGLQEILRAQREATEKWIMQREADLRRAASNAEARGRQVYAGAIKTGERVLARTPAEVRRLGYAVEAGARVVVPKVQTAARKVDKFVRAATSDDPYQREQALKGAGQQIRAATSGFVDEASFHLADRALSAGAALAEGGFGRFGDLYSQHMDVKRAEDAYDQEHYGTARSAGRIAGVGTGIAVLGAPGVVRGVVSLAPKGAKLVETLTTSRYALDPRGLTAMAAAGGAGAGVISQGVSDVTSGRVSPARDYGGAAVGGAIDGVGTLRFGPVVGGGLGGAATAVAQDHLAGRPISVDHMLEGGQMSALLGGLGGAATAYGTNRLSVGDKGNLAEFLSKVKTIARGDGVPSFGRPTRFYLDEGGYTYPDVQFKSGKIGKEYGIVESKVGPSAKKSPRQLQAEAQPNIDYVVDGWRYSDLGKMGGAAASPFAMQFDDDDRRARGRY